MFRGTCSSIEMLKGYMERESSGTPAIKSPVVTIKVASKKRFAFQIRKATSAEKEIRD